MSEQGRAGGKTPGGALAGLAKLSAELKDDGSRGCCRPTQSASHHSGHRMELPKLPSGTNTVIWHVTPK
jgi:hypothetical protein